MSEKVASYNKFNYNLRPSKTIERKLILNVLKEIYSGEDSSKLRYIGMGSIYFNDFKLFHRELHINDMVSIEGNSDDEERVYFNKPFNCIKILMGMSNEVLPFVGFEKKSIIWLDYDGSLNKSMFGDLETCFQNLKEGSFFLLTVNAKLQRYYDERKNFYKLDLFRKDFGEFVPDGINETDLTSSKSGSLIRTMFINKINEVLIRRFSYLSEKEKITFNQLLFFEYNDGSPMISIGGILCNKQTNKKYSSLLKKKFYFISLNENPYSIDFPKLTSLEVSLLNSKLPSSKYSFLKNKKVSFIPLEFRENFFELYKFYPYFFELRDL